MGEIADEHEAAWTAAIGKMDPGPYRAIKCPCGHRACESWMVSPVAYVQGVSFTQEQAEAVVELLTKMTRGEI